MQDLTPLEQRTLSDEAAEKLRAAIRSGSLAPGARLIERELAERLGVSRIPVREAIQKLIDEGLVKKLSHRAAYVYVPSRHEIEEISSLRVVLEHFVVERVVERWKTEHEIQLRDIVHAMRTAALQNDLQQVYALDYKFHHLVWQVADHTLLLEVVSGLRSRISRFLYEANSALPPSELENHIASHDYLIDVLKEGDAERAKEAITQHVLGAKIRILTYCDFPNGADGKSDT